MHALTFNINFVYILIYACTHTYAYYISIFVDVQLLSPVRPPGSSVHGISQVRIQEWVAIFFPRESLRPRDQIHVSCIGRRILYCWAAREYICLYISTYLCKYTYVNGHIHIQLAMVHPFYHFKIIIYFIWNSFGI